MTVYMAPVVFEWRENDEHPGTGIMIPVRMYYKICERQFVFGQQYPMLVVEPRDMKSHNHYFAALNEAWKNLAEEVRVTIPTAEHLRHWALIETGFCSITVTDCATPAHAENSARNSRKHLPFARIKRRGNVVEIRSAESQQIAPPPFGMTNERFKESKKAVLDLVSTLARTDAKTLYRETEGKFPPESREPKEPEQPRKPPPAKDGGAPGSDQTPTSGSPTGLAGALDQVGQPPTKDQVQTISDYAAYARAYIEAATDLATAQGQYDGERGWRDVLRVPINVRNALQGRIDDKFAR